MLSLDIKLCDKRRSDLEEIEVVSTDTTPSVLY
jgi:hypothetical protein